MEPQRFDRLVLALTQSRTRRSLLGLLGALGLTALVRDEVLAACAANGTRCGRVGDLACCSGRCVRKSGTNKKFCRAAPGQGICTIESNSCGGTVTLCTGGGISCECYVTSRGFSFCGAIGGPCFACETDAACERRVGGQPGDRCVPCASCGTGNNNRACVSKCPNPI
jgi:hypothetical protein